MRKFLMAVLTGILVCTGAWAIDPRAAALPEGSNPTEKRIREEIVFLAESMSGATAAMMCHLRSDYWFNTLQAGILATVNRIQADARAAAPEYAARATSWFYTYPGPMPPTPFVSACRAIAAGEQLKVLDRMQVDATGNYH
jgi:hypothetical protein